MTRILLVLPLLLIALNVLLRRRRAGASAAATSESLDDRTLSALREAGADFSRPTEVNFFLFFATEGHARSAAEVGRREGYTAAVQQPAKEGSPWSCMLTREMIPHASGMAAARDRMEELATSLDGEFDGWEAAVTE